MAQWIKPGINVDFVGNFRTFGGLSVLAVVASILVMVVNVFVRGSAQNYGTDFKGGSEIQVEFKREVSTAALRAALDKGGFKGAEVVKVSDRKRPHFFMLRMNEVSAFSAASEARMNAELEGKFGKGNVRRFEYKGGGDKVYVQFKPKFPVTPAEIEALFKKEKVELQQVQRFGRAEDNTYEVALAGLERDLRRLLEVSLGQGIIADIPQIESVGAKAGKELRDDGIKSVMYSLILILIYVVFRFDLIYGPGAVLSLIHDVIITTGVFALTWQEFSLSVVAALLTLAGYSINDTIVVYDRIRENVAKLRDRQFPLIVNASINETLSRTILTSLTTLFTCASIWIVGTGELKPFAFALTFGIVVGTYSSIFIASPLTILLHNAISKRKTRV